MAQDNAVHILNIVGTPTLFDIHGTSLGPIGGLTEPLILTQPLTIKMAPDSGMIFGKDSSNTELWRLGNDIDGSATITGNDGGGNVWLGYHAGIANQPSIIADEGVDNVGIGDRALASNTVGEGNVAIGSRSLPTLTEGTNNTAVGYRTLPIALDCSSCVAIGYGAMELNVSGSNNTAVGRSALQDMISNFNTAMGYRALRGVAAGANNVGVGANTGANAGNTARVVFVGDHAGYEAIGADGSVAVGYYAGAYDTEGNHLWFDNRERTNLADAKAKSLIVGTFADTVANQYLRFNAQHISTPALPTSDPHVLGDQYTDAGVMMVSNG